MPDIARQSAGAATLDALRERGADRTDPVRFHFAESLARRAGAHSGAARRVLDIRLAALLQAISAAVAGQRPVRPDLDVSRPRRGALGELVDHAANLKPAPPPGLATTAREGGPGRAATGAAADPTTLQFFQRTWSRLSADQRLAQSRASLPDNAGPLNSHHLVHRSLTLMRELSPEYLERFVGYIDALQWLEQANEAAAQEAASATRASAGKRSLPARR